MCERYLISDNGRRLKRMELIKIRLEKYTICLKSNDRSFSVLSGTPSPHIELPQTKAASHSNTSQPMIEDNYSMMIAIIPPMWKIITNEIVYLLQVRTLFVSGLQMDAKPRELYLLFRAYEVNLADSLWLFVQWPCTWTEQAMLNEFRRAFDGFTSFTVCHPPCQRTMYFRLMKTEKRRLCWH